MTDTSTRRQEVVKHSEKQARLDQFFGFYLDRLLADWSETAAQHSVTVLARSPETPVARAVLTNATDLLSAGVVMQIIFLEFDRAAQVSEFADLALISAESETAEQVQIFRLTNPALLDAHEQMVLGTDMSWCGDAMRRNPLQRDTVEVFDPCCPATALQSTRAFLALRAKADRIKLWARRAEGGQTVVAGSATDVRAHAAVANSAISSQDALIGPRH